MTRRTYTLHTVLNYLICFKNVSILIFEYYEILKIVIYFDFFLKIISEIKLFIFEYFFF